MLLVKHLIWNNERECSYNYSLCDVNCFFVPVLLCYSCWNRTIMPKTYTTFYTLWLQGELGECMYSYTTVITLYLFINTL